VPLLLPLNAKWTLFQDPAIAGAPSLFLDCLTSVLALYCGVLQIRYGETLLLADLPTKVVFLGPTYHSKFLRALQLLANCLEMYASSQSTLIFIS
jgi:hypothetical protein